MECKYYYPFMTQKKKSLLSLKQNLTKKILAEGMDTNSVEIGCLFVALGYFFSPGRIVS